MYNNSLKLNTTLMSSSSMFNFRVHRCQPELVQPAAPTPHEIKLLSDIDNQECLRFIFPFIFIYRHQQSMIEKDPIKVLRDALSQTLVYYYPLAGRIREGAGGKLMVDCNGEGVMFIEAEADVTLDQFGDSLHPPFPWYQQLLDDVHGTQQVIDHPILLIQVTRLKCGGFILSLNINHVISDATGLKQFMNAWAKIARGAHQPSIQPIWRRELLMARNPPRVTCDHREYEQIILPPKTIKKEDTTIIVHQSFLFTPAHVAAIRCLVPLHLRQCTAFDLITACFWHCRTKALQLEPEEEVRIMCAVDARSRLSIANHSSLVGYYGNCSAYPAVVTSVGKLICGNSLGYAVELIKKAKGQVTREYMHSLADLTVIKERCIYNTIRSCVVSDMTRAKYENVNFGWGETVYGGVVKGGAEPLPGVTFMVPHKNVKEEGGLILLTYLPYEDMERFAQELNKMFGSQNQPTTSGPSFVMSSL